MMDMLFSSWESLGRILFVGVGAYLGLIIILRTSGNRTLSKMNSFDFVVTVALGSTLSSGILQKSVSLADTLLAFVLLVGLQYVVTWLSVRSKAVDEIVKSEPALLFHSGKLLRNSMKKARVTEEEVRSAARQQGFDSLNQVEAVVMETNGRLSAIGHIGHKQENVSVGSHPSLLPQS